MFVSLGRAMSFVAAWAMPAMAALSARAADAGGPAKPVEAAATQPAAAATVDAARIDQWVKELDAATAAARDAAVEKLTTAGLPAVGAAAKAAKGDNPEVTIRAIKVLTDILGRKDSAAGAAAKAALEELAKDEKHDSGRLAREALSVGRRPAVADNGTVINLGGNVIRGQVMVVGGGPGAVAIAVTEAGGTKETNVEENGRKTRIIEDKDGITVTVTEPAKGDEKPETKTYKAASAKELKEKHPEGYKLYEKHANQGVAAGNVGFAGGGAGRAAEARKRAELARAAITRRAQAPRILEEAQQELEKVEARLKEAVEARSKPDAKDVAAPDLAELLKQVESIKAKLAEARRGLDPAELRK